MVLFGLEQLTTFASFLDSSGFSVLIRSVSLVLNLSVCTLLLSGFGISSAAFAAVLSTLTVLALNHRFLRRLADYQVPWRGILE